MEIHTIEPFLDYFESIRARTRRVVLCIPPERLEEAPAPGLWSLGDLVRHLAATERHMFAENVLGRPSAYAGHGRHLADGFDAVLAYFDHQHAESVALFRTLTPDQLQAKCTPPSGAPLTTWKWLRAMVEHEVHHRGQIYLRLALMGIPTPPIYGLTSEEVRERSRR
ncbi:MAG: DinB family protein [Thermoanaerobaculia bacterium]|nr:DinB family protein [Thermoanaerobaculia bacterium]